MTHLKSFTILIALTFGAPWLLLIVIPHISLQDLAPVAYSEDELELADSTVYPPVAAGRVSNGHNIYAAEGCAYCHTQMVRPPYLAPDMWREGWAGRGPKWGDLEGQDEGKPVPYRVQRPEDYLGEKFAFLGVQRNGPDLSNVGWRITDREETYRHLYNPRSVNWRSNMPAFKHLFKVQRIGGQPSDKALKLEDEFAVEAGFEVVPTAKADALVSYLMSLKKDYLVPESVGGKSVTFGAAQTGTKTSS